MRKSAVGKLFSVLLLSSCPLALLSCGEEDPRKKGSSHSQTEAGDFTLSLRESHQGYYVDDYKGKESVVTVPNDYEGTPIVGVSPYAFFKRNHVKTLRLGENVVALDDNAFTYSSIVRLEVTGHLYDFTPKAFEESDIAFNTSGSLSYLPSWTSDYGLAYKRAPLEEGQTAYVLEEGCEAIYKGIFSDTKEQTSVLAPLSIHDIGEGNFGPGLDNYLMFKDPEAKNKELTIYRTFPYCVYGIGKNTVTKCPYKLRLAEGIKSLSTNALRNGGFDSVELPSTLEEIGYDAFTSASLLKEITIPANVKTVLGNPFSSCSALTTISVNKDNVYLDNRGNAIMDSITDYLLGACASSYIPEQTKGLGQFAFWGTDIKEAYIPKGCVDIGTKAFAYCEELTKLEVDPENEAYDSRENCNAILRKTDQIEPSNIPGGSPYVSIPAGVMVAACKESKIPDSTTKIMAGAFCFNSPYSLAIPASFSAKLTLNPFSELKNLTSITVDVDNQTYDSRSGCNAVMKTAGDELLVASDVTKIPALTAKIGYRAFTNRAMTSIELDPNVKVIDDQAFYSCPKLSSVKIASGTERIGMSAFGDCPALENFEMPNTVKELGTAIWTRCPKLTSILYKGTSEEWEDISKHDNDPFNYSSITEVRCSDKTIPVGE